jgi:hypothetical protein
MVVGRDGEEEKMGTRGDERKVIDTEFCSEAAITPSTFRLILFWLFRWGSLR